MQYFRPKFTDLEYATTACILSIIFISTMKKFLISFLLKEAEQLREETLSQQKRIMELEQIDTQNKGRIISLETLLAAQEK